MRTTLAAALILLVPALAGCQNDTANRAYVPNTASTPNPLQAGGGGGGAGGM